MVDARRYTYRVEWSAEDGEFVATVLEFPSLSWLDADRVEALAGLVRLVVGVIEDTADNGEIVPEPSANADSADNSWSAQWPQCTVDSASKP